MYSDNVAQSFKLLIFYVSYSFPGNIGFSEAIQRRIERKKRERLPLIPQTVSQAAELLEANPELGYVFTKIGLLLYSRI